MSVKTLKYIFVLALSVFNVLATAEENPVDRPSVSDELLVRDPWVRATPAGMQNTAIYFELINRSETTLTLVEVSSDRAIRAELHQHLMEAGLMKMEKVESVEIPAGSSINFKPGGYHVMMIGLNKTIEHDEKIEVSLILASGVRKTIVAIARPY
ncbi:MAG: copper(I)-binding protein [Cellvibrionaceae bacterium]|jgi:copper(I)-binding protein